MDPFRHPQNGSSSYEQHPQSVPVLRAATSDLGLHDLKDKSYRTIPSSIPQLHNTAQVINGI